MNASNSHKPSGTAPELNLETNGASVEAKTFKYSALILSAEGAAVHVAAYE